MTKRVRKGRAGRGWDKTMRVAGWERVSGTHHAAEDNNLVAAGCSGVAVACAHRPPRCLGAHAQ